MTIIEKEYKWAGRFDYRTETRKIVLHHAAAKNCSADDIHSWHLNNGWVGIGYHFFIRKDGSVYRGRPENATGAHAQGSNSNSIGICFEGDYRYDTMPAAQVKAGAELVKYIKGKYGIYTVVGHRDVATAGTTCPGKNFPFDEIASGKGVEDKEGKVMVEVRELYADMSGGDVKAMQAVLIAKGFNCGKAGADGIFGADTLSAVKRYQKSCGIATDGIVGKDTWTKLLS